MKIIKGFFNGTRLVIDILILFVISLAIYLSHYIYTAGYVDEFIQLYRNAEAVVEAADASDFTRDATGTSYYDAEGNIISMSYGGRYLEYDEIPSNAVDAIVAIEDSRFFTHKGVDLKGIARAAYSLYEKNGTITQGGSTITQQLLKLEYLSSDRTYTRKITEILAALLFEIKFTKEDIMEFYLNTIYFANGYYGIDAAAYGYFGTDTTQLSTAELAFILAIPNSPSKYDPYVNPQETKARQERILKAMYNEDYLTADEYVAAVGEDIMLVKKGSQDVLVDNTDAYPFSFIQREAIKTIMAVNGFEFQYYFSSDAEEALYDEAYENAYNAAKQDLASGYIVHTSISIDAQKELQESVDNFMDTVDVAKTDENVYEYQAAATCINNKTGLVEAMVGSRTDGSFLNRAYQSYRQPGSAIKPIVVYAPAIELKGYDADSIVLDEEIEDGCVNAYRGYLGEITLRTAVAKSVNTVAWNMFNEIGPSRGISYLKDMNFARITKSDYNLATSLGGMTYGASTLEMASAYATLYNDGIYRTPTCITSIYDDRGVCIYEYDAENGKRVYSKNAANEMVDMMTSVFTEGTAKNIALNEWCAGKTGTTSDNKDSWFCGITERYSTAVWVGRDDAAQMSGRVSGALFAGNIWHNYMVRMGANLPSDDENAGLTVDEIINGAVEDINDIETGASMDEIMEGAIDYEG